MIEYTGSDRLVQAQCSADCELALPQSIVESHTGMPES